jgi:hypothetical protein
MTAPDQPEQHVITDVDLANASLSLEPGGLGPVTEVTPVDDPGIAAEVPAVEDPIGTELADEPNAMAPVVAEGVVLGGALVAGGMSISTAEDGSVVSSIEGKLTTGMTTSFVIRVFGMCPACRVVGLRAIETDDPDRLHLRCENEHCPDPTAVDRLLVNPPAMYAHVPPPQPGGPTPVLIQGDGVKLVDATRFDQSAVPIGGVEEDAAPYAWVCPACGTRQTGTGPYFTCRGQIGKFHRPEASSPDTAVVLT